MPQLFQTEVYGIQPVLQVLKQLEPELYKEITAKLKSTADPLRAHAAAGFPAKPMTSWTLYGRTVRGRKMPDTAGASFPRYQQSKAKAGVKIKVGGRRKVRDGKPVYPILAVIQSNAGGQIYDLAQNAQSKRGTQFVANLARDGKPSRVMWKRVKEKYPEVQDDIAAVLRSIQNRFSAEIAHTTYKSDAQSKRASKQARNALGRFGG